MYDVFINHKNDCKPWVDILAENLKAEGYKVFMDGWEPVPEQSITANLYEGLKKSGKEILVVTPVSIESGWIKEEFDRAMIHNKEDHDFAVIPVVLGKEIPDFPFLKDISWVDFRNPGQYRESFYRLLCTLENRSPEPPVKLKEEPVIPTDTHEPLSPGHQEISLVEELFEGLSNRQAVVLLAQDDRLRGMEKRLILEKAPAHFDVKSILHLVPPIGIHVDMEDYFYLLGKQCGFSQVITNPTALISAFQDRLEQEEKLFLMVSGFENSFNRGQEEFAGILRSLNERCPKKLKILVLGGEKLANLVYTGELSYLNHADIIEWPELTADDVIRRAKALHPSLTLDKKAAEKMLEMSGSHPRILETCLDLYTHKPSFTIEDLAGVLVKTLWVWQLFRPFSESSSQIRKLCESLTDKELGPASPYLYSPFLRQLYWRNLLKRSSVNNRLYWRCEALRSAASRILGCEADTVTAEKPVKNIFITALNINTIRHLNNIIVPLDREHRKHLILTGKNGSGKTSVLESLKRYLSGLVKKKAEPPWDEVSLTFNDDLSAEFYSPGNFIIAYYGARRAAGYPVPKTIEKIALKDQYNIDELPGKEFIRYMVKLSADKSFAAEAFDYRKTQKIQDWFESFEECLKDIFEDPSLRLEFDSENYNFNIRQEGKNTFDFNTLADGYSAIIGIVTDLILRMEKHKSKSYNIQGIVLIDEVEAHLHISLQKKILPFLTSFFPGIQFIVTTHSPFVLNSIEDAVIYDLERHLLISDLSGYSYAGIVEGYFDNDKYSEEIKKKINLYERLINREQRTPDEQNLAMELRMYLREIPGSLAPELKSKFQEIEANRKARNEHT